MRFVDTNVLLYAVSTASDEADKRTAAGELLRSADLAVSTQVLGEFYVQATRSTRADPLSHSQASRLVESFTRFRVQPVTVGIVRAALRTCDRHRISYWDAAIVEAARASGCHTILTEDLSHGQDIDGVQVINPFHEV